MRFPGQSFTRRKFLPGMMLLSIVVLGLLVRLWGVDFGLPYLYHPDEPNKIEIAQNIFKTGDLNPRYFLKPTLFIYFNALAYVPYYLYGQQAGVFESPDDILPPIMLDMGVGIAPLPTAALMGRLLTVFIATASIPLVYFIGRQISHRSAVGLLAASMIAIFPTNVDNSRYITENSYLTFFILVVLWASVRIYQSGRTRDYWIAGIATGLAVSSKYPGVIIAVVPFVSHLLSGRGGLKDRRLYTMYILVPLVFFLTTPYAILDYTKFLEDSLYEVDHYASGHDGMEGGSLVWYMSYMFYSAGIVYALAFSGMLRGFVTKSREMIILSAFPIVYLVFISSFVVRNDRTFLPMTPFLYILAAWFLVFLFDQIRKVDSKRVQILLYFTLIGVSAFGYGLPARTTFQHAVRLTVIDSRATSAEWVNENLPKGSSVAIEAYAPYVNPESYTVRGFGSLIFQAPEWYVANGFDYLIFSEGQYGRYYREPEKYSSQISQYESFFNYFEPVRIFSDGGYEIRIYAVQHPVR